MKPHLCRNSPLMQPFRVLVCSVLEISSKYLRCMKIVLRFHSLRFVLPSDPPTSAWDLSSSLRVSMAFKMLVWLVLSIAGLPVLVVL